MPDFKKYLRITPVTFSIVMAILGCAAYWAEVPFLDLIELKTVDLRFVSRGERAPGDEVVLAVIDEKSLDKEGKWVWPRSKMVAMLDKLSEAGARVVAFDIGFLEADDKRVVRAIDQIQETLQRKEAVDDALIDYLDRLRAGSDYDRMLAEAVSRSKAKVVLGYFFHMGQEAEAQTGGDAIEIQKKSITGSSYKLVHYTSAAAEKFPFIEATAPEANIPEISAATPYAGFFNMFPDSDGVVRWIPAVIKFKETLYAPLSLMALSAYLDKPLSAKVDSSGVVGIQVGKQFVPTDELGRILIDYYGGVKTFPHISITDILHDNVDPAGLKDKIVLVGATAVGIYDMRVTPFGSVFPGLEIHANVVGSILSEAFMYQPGWSRIFDTLAIVVAGMAIGFALSRFSAVPGAMVALGLFAGYIALCQSLFVRQGWVLNLVYPLVVMVLTYTGITAYKYFSEARQKKFIRDAFSSYLAPAVVQQLIESPKSLNLGGEERNITAFFSDVQGFTGISEELSPKDLVELLNNFLTEMTDIILAYQGTVDKFEGDAIIAFFGAPYPMENHPEVACRSCIDMQKRLTDLRVDWRDFGWPELNMRIGLCSGSAVVGNMGSKNRMDYTMMGDTVNIAARLEGVNKVYGTYTMISDTTFREIGDGIVAREVDSVFVVGRDEPVTVYELIGYEDEVDTRTLNILDLYAKGLQAYRNREWQDAMKHFMAALKLNTHDGPSRTMFMRSRSYMDRPPSENWNGAFSIRSK